jgi:hypothetical protein
MALFSRVGSAARQAAGGVGVMIVVVLVPSRRCGRVAADVTGVAGRVEDRTRNQG